MRSAVQHARQVQPGERRVRRLDGQAQRAEAVGLREACRRLNRSYRTGQRMLAAGTFPIPELPRPPRGPGSRKHLFSTVDIELFLTGASVADVA